MATNHTPARSTPIKLKKTSKPSHTISKLEQQRDDVLSDFKVIPVYPFDQLADSVQGAVSQEDMTCAKDALSAAGLYSESSSPDVPTWSAYPQSPSSQDVGEVEAFKAFVDIYQTISDAVAAEGLTCYVNAGSTIPITLSGRDNSTRPDGWIALKQSRVPSSAPLPPNAARSGAPRVAKSSAVYVYDHEDDTSKKGSSKAPYWNDICVPLELKCKKNDASCGDVCRAVLHTSALT